MTISRYISTKIAEFLIRRAVSMDTLSKKNLVNWEPWKGCYAVSPACKSCYYYAQHSRRFSQSQITKTDDFDKPVSKSHKNALKIPGGKTVVTCFMSDFFIEEADKWRHKAWQVIKQRSDLTFLILTKRIDRFHVSLPADWGDGYDNVIIGCTIENQEVADYRLPLFLSYPIKRRFISCVPLLEKINLEPYLSEIDHVTVGGEIGQNVRECDYDWILDIQRQCAMTETSFWFKNTGSLFRKDGIAKKVHPVKQARYAKKLSRSFNTNI